jgi:hypothetical protein
MTDARRLAGEYFDAWWHHDKVWREGNFPNAEFEKANVATADLASKLRKALKLGDLGLLRQPVEGNRRIYIEQMGGI